ncbi:competence protein ComK [Bacillus sp. N9]
MCSEVVETDGKYICTKSPFKLVKTSCKYFGSTYEGRKTATKELIGVSVKAPIIIDPHTSIFLFPTASPLTPHCIWVSHEHVKKYQMGERHSTIVTFENGEQYELLISHRSFEVQMQRTALLRIRYMQNIKRMEYYRTGETAEIKEVI